MASPAARVSIVITEIGNRAGIRDRVPSLGFTLIEILAVIVLIAIAATVSAVALRGHGPRQVDAAAQQIAAGLRDTRTRAMATGTPQWFSMDLRARTYAAPGRDPRRLPADTTMRVVSAAEDVAQAGVARIGYFPDGSSSGGTIELARAAHAVQVRVDWLTGAVVVADGTGK